MRKKEQTQLTWFNN